MRELLVVFGTVQRVLQAERLARQAGLDVDVIPAPRAVSSECGVVLEVGWGDAPRLEALLAESGPAPEQVFRAAGAGWLPSSLAAAEPVADPGLSRASAYGGCGAKLAKGVLDTVLCGLPRVESEDLLVGIESADDAGVVRIDENLGLIHTVDFFPPMVDDPFTFGRIAAANALSDVYAMGGTPLAGMNLVSFPLATTDRQVLKEILRGGLDALAEAGAVLAGGHTVEGAELLYGMAVTGKVDPRCIWRNGGARPGDVLVLTKALGTGVITTAARAGLVEPAHLSRAVRSMAALNRRAAEAARRVEPSAVTDVTGFGLAGHGAEVALASSLAIELHLEDLPLLDGALEAAGQGFVPVGAGKNRESLGESLVLAEGVDPLRVDLALDPQTSGGLLIACAEDRAQHLCGALGGARVVGRCVSGEAGEVRLG